MTYATPQDLAGRFDAHELAQLAVPQGFTAISGELLQLTIDDGDRSAFTADEISAADAALAKINRALADAAGDIDGHVSARYRLPLSSVPLVLKRTASDLARYYLYDDHAPEQIAKRYDDAIKLLLNVSRGTVSLGVDDAGAAAQSNDAAIVNSGGNVFDRNKAKDFI